MSKKTYDRNDMRSRFFSEENKRRKSQIVDLLGVDVELRQPTIGQITQIAKKNEGSTDSALVAILIEYCYVPGTEDKFFEEGDKEGLLSMPSGDWLLKFNEALAALTGVNVKEAEGNLPKTALN